MATAHTLEELVQLLQDERKYYFGSDELEKLGLSEIIKHRLESWGMPAAIYDPKGGMELALPHGPEGDWRNSFEVQPDPPHDPVDMIKVEEPSDAEMALVQITAMISDAAQDLQKADDAGSPEVSWLIDLHAQRAQAQAQIAIAQASYAIALQLSRIGDLCEGLLQAKDD